MLPPRESPDRGNELWLLLTAAYRLIISNIKRQHLSDDRLLNIAFAPTAPLLQLLVMRRWHNFVSLAAKIIAYILLCGLDHVVPSVMAQIDARCTLGTIVHGPGHLRYFGLNLNQRDDMASSVDGD